MLGKRSNHSTADTTPQVSMKTITTNHGGAEVTQTSSTVYGARIGEGDAEMAHSRNMAEPMETDNTQLGKRRKKFTIKF